MVELVKMGNVVCGAGVFILAILLFSVWVSSRLARQDAIREQNRAKPSSAPVVYSLAEPQALTVSRGEPHSRGEMMRAFCEQERELRREPLYLSESERVK